MLWKKVRIIRKNLERWEIKKKDSYIEKRKTKNEYGQLRKFEIYEAKGNREHQEYRGK